MSSVAWSHFYQNLIRFYASVRADEKGGVFDVRCYAMLSLRHESFLFGVRELFIKKHTILL